MTIINTRIWEKKLKQVRESNNECDMGKEVPSIPLIILNIFLCFAAASDIHVHMTNRINV